MSVLIGYVASVVLATLLSASVVVISKRPLRQLLVELCGNSARAEYWTTFTGLLLVLSTLYGVLATVPPADSRAGAEHADLVAALSTFRSGVLSLLIASLLVAFVLLRFVARQEELARRKPSWMETRELTPPPRIDTPAR